MENLSNNEKIFLRCALESASLSVALSLSLALALASRPVAAESAAPKFCPVEAVRRVEAPLATTSKSTANDKQKSKATAGAKSPKSAGSLPAISLQLPGNWDLIADPEHAGSYPIQDRKTHKPVARLDWDRAHTDQKMLPAILEQKMTLGSFTVTKFTVTTDPEELGPKDHAKEESSVITSYDFEGTKLDKLILMTETYDKSGCLEDALEKVIASIAMK